MLLNFMLGFEKPFVKPVVSLGARKRDLEK